MSERKKRENEWEMRWEVTEGPKAGNEREMGWG